MKIIIGSDHNGYEIKKTLIEYLKTLNFNIEDAGAMEYDELDDYPLYAKKVCDEVLKEEKNIGILICGSGIGMSIAANKVRGIRCAKVDNEEEAKMARLHNNANVVAISSKKSIKEIQNITLNFVNNDFSGEERHIRRINQINEF